MRVRCWVITLFIIGVCMGGKKSGKLFLPKKLPSRGLRGFTWPQKPFISSTLRFLPLWSLTHSIINKWNVLYCKFFTKCTLKMAFGLTWFICHLEKHPHLKRAGEGMTPGGQPRAFSWDVVCGPWSCWAPEAQVLLNISPIPHPPGSVRSQEARTEMWSGLSMSKDHRPHNPWGSFYVLAPSYHLRKVAMRRWW